ncbi:DUF2167 domain-containing protein [Polynucleobacter sp. AP-Capit-er-40B-B4]|uniref:DUF2167 domain-containing protein n=1 Tax=Polynucleobacter sp. AP-Capit-er-40B-B4 TaxID=2576927 RepID=UPI001C0E8108|nr:DUF2167 domain-containing protein [Polynucleobacter sp. AP-Capit-er-40B-B4]MBU3580776.1 DUF2167 domain-containing protein [Polynucleobacter sp. AP-Capit-er-40B-B4]
MRKILVALSLSLLTIFSANAANELSEADKALLALDWKTSPATGDIGDKAKIKIPKDVLFLGNQDTQKFLKLNGNPEAPNTYTIYNPTEGWFAIFHFTAAGYVKDDEKIDADALMKSMKERDKVDNEDRKKEGLPPLYLDGWYIPPRYDSATKRLEWATKLHDEKNVSTINFSTRILGRGGYMSAVLVTDPKTLDRDIKSFNTALTKFEYNPGERYSEFKEGDKIAAYGLGALVAGGAAAAVASKGGFKLLWVAILGAFAAVGAFVKKLFGKKQG